MGRAEKRKMELLQGQIVKLLRENRLKVLGSVLQNLNDSERQQIFGKWNDHSIEDDYSHSTVSSMEELDLEDDVNENDNNKKQQQNDDDIIIIVADEELEEPVEMKKIRRIRRILIRKILNQVTVRKILDLLMIIMV